MFKHTARSHPEATNRHHEDGLLDLFVVASAISFPYPYIQLLIAMRSLEEQMFYQPSTFFLPFQLASSKLQGLSRPDP